MEPTKYSELSQVPVTPWRIQGTVYADIVDAKFAAAKLFCVHKGVVVKAVKGGYSPFYWG